MLKAYSSEQVGQILLARRKELRMTQADVAVRLGISQNRWSELENRPAQLTLERLLALAGILDLEWLVQERSETSIDTAEW